MLVCLLPARNCAGDLPGYFESVARFADAIVALDDGSTDATGELLAGTPLVRVRLQNRRRDGYESWDDSANRNQLLAAAAELEPTWIISLDADERIDPTDAAALRDFVAGDAVPGDAYLFRVFRMIRDLAHYDESHLWVGRLFAFERGQRFPADRLHFVPLPTSIPRARWRRTTFRIQHLASLTESRRRARFEKYRAADPERRFQADYSHLLRPPVQVKAWSPRSPDLPVFPNSRRVRAPSTGGTPALSTIVVAHDDASAVERVVASAVNQPCPEAFEVIVVTSGSARITGKIHERFPEVALVEVERSAPIGPARNAGLSVASGEYVSFETAAVELAPGSHAARIRAHRLGYAMVSGTPVNETRTLSSWASYFVDYGTVLPLAPARELADPPLRCSYLRSALVELGGFPAGAGREPDAVISRELFARGFGAYHAPDLLFVHDGLCRTPSQLLRHHFSQGRAACRLLLDDAQNGDRLRWRRIRRHFAARVPRRLRQVTRDARRWGGSTRSHYPPAVPLIVSAVVSEWLGARVELARHVRSLRRNRSEVDGGIPADDPVGGNVLGHNGAEADDRVRPDRDAS